MEKRGRRGPGGDRDIRRGKGQRPSGEERLSRFLAFVLRHHPEEIGLALDEQGAADLDALAGILRQRPGFDTVTRERIEHLVSSGPAASRFEILADRIRARYGHSLPQAIQYEPAAPPAELFHGTTPEGADEILKEGLRAGQRQRVHLSVDVPAAHQVGARRCVEPVVLRIDTAAALKAGVRFYPAGPAVWLADDIPAECIARAP